VGSLLTDVLVRNTYTGTKGKRSKTSIYPVFEVIPEMIGTGSTEDTRTTQQNIQAERGLVE
jgi:hypothetical protein